MDFMSGQAPTNQTQTAGVQETKTRFFSQEYADIAKLREMSLKNAHMAAKLRHKGAKYMTSMEKYRHKATICKEKQVMMLDRIPDVQARMKELQDELNAGASGVADGGTRPRDQSRLHLKIRSLQEKIVKIQRKAAAYEVKATHYLSVSSQKKVQADIFMEKAVPFDTEAKNLNTRADRLQQATESDVIQASPGRAQ